MIPVSNIYFSILNLR